MDRIRYRLARWLIGPFVNIPARSGVWIVTRLADGISHTIIEAASLEMTFNHTLNLRRYGDDSPAYNPSTASGTFSGTVKA